MMRTIRPPRLGWSSGGKASITAARRTMVRESLVVKRRERYNAKGTIEMMMMITMVVVVVVQEPVKSQQHPPPRTPLYNHANGDSRMGRTTFLSTS